MQAVYQEYPSYCEMAPTVLMKIFRNLVGEIQQKQPTTKRNSLQMIDSTTIPLNQHLFPWATFRSTKSGINLHLNLCYMDENQQYPEDFTIINAKVHDRTQIEVLVNKPEATYIVDRGYFDYKLFGKMHRDGFFFDTRIKQDGK